MDDLNSTINAILGDPAKMEQLRSVAQSLGLNPGNAPPAAAQPQAPTQPQAAPGNGGGFDPSAIASILQNFQNLTGGGANAAASGAADAAAGSAASAIPNLGSITKIAEIMQTFNQSDKNVELLRSLKPHFSPSRAGKIDDAVRIMQIIRVWPSLRDSGLLGSLGNLFGGGGSK